MKIQYTNRIVAFIDVLGFSELVREGSTNRLNDYFTYLTEEFGNYTNPHFEYIILSDSVILFCEHTHDNLLKIVRILSIIQAKLLTRKILLRGGISYGNLFVDKTHNIIVGDALIAAYNLENIANYPRIIIDRRFIVNHKEGMKDFYISISDYVYTGYKNELFDGNLHVDYVKYIVKTQHFYKAKRFDCILELFKENYYNNKLYEKYAWLLREFIYWLECEMYLLSNRQLISLGQKRIFVRGNRYLSEFKKL